VVDVSAEASTEAKPVARAGLGAFISLPALGAILFWSGVAPFGKYALDEIPTLAYAALRPVIAAAVVFGFLSARRQSLSIRRSDWSRMAVAGIGCMGMSQLLFIGGLSLTSVAHCIILATTSPLLAAMIRGVFRRELPDKQTALGMLTGFVGVVVLVTDAGSNQGTSVTGDLLSLGSALAWVGATMMPQPLVVRYGAPLTTAWLLLGSSFLLVPIGFLQIVDMAQNPPSTSGWLALFYGGAIGMLGGNALWQKAVQEIGAARTFVYLYLEPVLAMVLAALVLGERMTVTQGIGGVLALAGVALVRKG
jgi:drug/metabolite transporter (DMT)-like permease